MRIYIIIKAIAATLVVLSGTLPISAQHYKEEQKAVWNEVNKKWTNWQSGDLDAAFSYLHEEFLGWNEVDAIPVSKSELVGNMKEMQNRISEINFKIEPAKILIHQNSAVIHYYYEYSFMYNTGEGKQLISDHGKWSEFLVKEDERWMLIGEFTFHHNASKANKISGGSIMKNIFKTIEFESQGATLRGRLYLPESEANQFPVIIMAHGFTTTINGMTADKYAERFRESGYAVVLYDHINLGISDGEPRQEINFWVQSRGYIDAIDFVFSKPEIDNTKIAVWGASLSAREAFLVGTIDARVKAVITMIPAFGEELPLKDQNGSSYIFAKETLLSNDIKSLPHTITGKIPIVSIDQIGSPSALTELTAYRWFIEYGGRFGTNWQNVVSFSKIDAPEDFHLGQLAQNLKAPILMIVATNDEMNGANPMVTEYVYNTIIQPKEWVEIDGGHFGLLYYPSELFDKSSKAQIDFLNKYLR